MASPNFVERSPVLDADQVHDHLHDVGEAGPNALQDDGEVTEDLFGLSDYIGTADQSAVAVDR
jgi:hypothetical protein